MVSSTSVHTSSRLLKSRSRSLLILEGVEGPEFNETSKATAKTAPNY